MCTSVHGTLRPPNPHSGSTKGNVFAFDSAEMEKSSGSSNKRSACNRITLVLVQRKVILGSDYATLVLVKREVVPVARKVLKNTVLS